MAKNARRRPTGRFSFSGKLAQVNPWIPAAPVKRSRSKGLLRIVLAVPFVFTVGQVSAGPLPLRTLHVPAELTRQAISARELDETVLSITRDVLQKYEDKVLFAQGGKKGR